MTTDLIPRLICPDAVDALHDFRIVIVNGARQSGKTTLLQQLDNTPTSTYLSLDSGALRNSALRDPTGFVAQPHRPLLIDEIQRGGNDLVLAIKEAADNSRERRQFMLAGSTRFLATPSLTESLAGRAAILEIWPLAEQEIARQPHTFIDAVFEQPESLWDLRQPRPASRDDYPERICRGGFPEAMALSTERARWRWYETYVRSVVEVDIREMSKVSEPSNLNETLRVLAANTSAEMRPTKIASNLGLDRRTVGRLTKLLETVFLIHELPAWSRNLAARAIRHPKVHLTDTGLASFLLGVSPSALARPVAPARGPLTETFVVNELAKQATWASTPVRLSHWRVSQGPEVDVVLERGNGEVVGVEVKARQTVRDSDFAGLVALRDLLGEQFRYGVVLYSGDRTLPFGDRLAAAPIRSLWSLPGRGGRGVGDEA